MRLKSMTEEKLNELISTIDNEGFWYSLTDGGWIKPEDVLDNEKDIKRVKEAVAILRRFEDLFPPEF